MFNALNDDCICEVLKYMNPLQLHCMKQRFLQLIGQNNARISTIFDEKMSRKFFRVKINVNTTGVIGIMNLKYLLYVYGNQIEELTISLTAFPSTFGVYTVQIKYDIIFLITTLAKNLKKLNLVGFNLHMETTYATDIFTRLYNPEVRPNNLVESLKISGVKIKEI